MANSMVSPELALVDPQLRADALAALPLIEEDAFLQFRRLPELTRRAPAQRTPPLALAATVYLLATAARVMVMDALFVLGLVAAVVGIQLVG